MNQNIAPLEKFEKAMLIAGCRQGKRTSGRDQPWTCPAHEDTHPSLDVREGDDGRVLFTCRAGCSQEAVLAALEFEARDLFPSSSARPGAQPGGQRRNSAGLSPNRGEERGGSEREGLTLEAYAEAKRLDVNRLESFGLRQVGYFSAPAVEIPYFDEAGERAAIRYRLRLEKGPEGDERFRWKKGSKPLLYGLGRVASRALVTRTSRWSK